MVDDGEVKDETKRRTRNLSEKKRRDQFNLLVNELGTMVTTNRKMDKSTVLKSTITFLKNHNEVTVQSRAYDIEEDWKPSFLSNEEFTYLILEALEGFVMVFSDTGRIFYVSESIRTLLGHKPSQVINKTLFELVCEDEVDHLHGLIQHPEGPFQEAISKENGIMFQCHLKRGTLDFRDAPTYELVQFTGYFRTNEEQMATDDMAGYSEEQDSRLLYVCTGSLCTPQLIRDVSLVDTKCNEFTSRYSLEWKFLFLDHRAPPIIGYLPFEVLGTSGYDYYHFDDLERIVMCHEALMQKGVSTSCYYRFLTKGQQWIWLQTRYYITYHQWNSKPDFVVCTHRVMSFSDVCENLKQEASEGVNALEIQPMTAVVTTAADDSMSYVSSILSEASEPYYGTSYQAMSQSASMLSTNGSTGTAATPSASAPWSGTIQEPPRYSAPSSDTTSLSGDSRSGHRSAREIHLCTAVEPSIVPQHGMGAQYLEPASYVTSVTVPVVTVPTGPVLVSQDQALMQEARQAQLQRKHQRLQQLIVYQQEELRQVKEQLILARLGILPTLVDATNEDVITHDHVEAAQPP